MEKAIERTISIGDFVTLECLGQLDNGMVFTDSSEDGNLSFRVGEYDVLAGLNEAILGLRKGDSHQIKLSPNQAFGDYDNSLVLEIPLETIQGSPRVGMQLKGETDDGKEAIWRVLEVSEKKGTATLDGNHMLAGQNINLKVKILDISRA